MFLAIQDIHGFQKMNNKLRIFHYLFKQTPN